MKFTNFFKKRVTKKNRASLRSLQGKLRENALNRNRILHAQENEQVRGHRIINTTARLGPRNSKYNNGLTRKAKKEARMLEAIRYYTNRKNLGDLHPVINAEGRNLSSNRSNNIHRAHLEAADRVPTPALVSEPFNIANPAAALKMKMKRNVNSRRKTSIKEKVEYYTAHTTKNGMAPEIQEQLLNDPDFDRIIYLL